MAVDLILAPEAAADLGEAYAWYEAQAVGRGEDFLGRIDDGDLSDDGHWDAGAPLAPWTASDSIYLIPDRIMLAHRARESDSCTIPAATITRETRDEEPRNLLYNHIVYICSFINQ